MTIHRGTGPGVSLVEALLALAILAGVLLGAIWLVHGARLHAERTRRRGVALRAASSLLERASAGPRSAWWSLGGPGVCDPAAARCVASTSAADPASPLGAWQTGLARSLPGGSASLSLEAVGGTLEQAALVRAVVVVRWREGANEGRTVLAGALR